MRITPRRSANAARRYYAEETIKPWSGFSVWGTLDIPMGRSLSWNDSRFLFKGIHPDTKEPLTRTKKGVRRSGWDLTFVAPKSVSILWGLADDNMREEIEEAHVKAVISGLSVLSEKAVYVRWHEDSPGPIYHGGFIFNHGLTRYGDPHLHTHAYLLNMGWLDDIGVWRAINLDAKWSRASRDFYLMEFAWHLVNKGFVLNKRRSNGFGVECLRFLEKTFSRAHEEAWSTQGMTEQRWRMVKKEKDLTLGFDRMRSRWLTRAIKAGLDPDILRPEQVKQKNVSGTVSASDVYSLSKRARHEAHVWHHAAMVGMGKAPSKKAREVGKEVYGMIFDKEGNNKYLRPEKFRQHLSIPD